MKNNLAQWMAARKLRMALALFYAFSVVLPANADLTDLASVPLANVAGTVAVKPNVMFVLDDSGSMGWDYMPDYVNDSSTSLAPPYPGTFGSPPYMSAYYNKQYYNPEIRYLPGVKADGSEYKSQTTWTAVQSDPYRSPTSVFDIVTKYRDYVYCKTAGASVTSSDCVTNSPGWNYELGYSGGAPYTEQGSALYKTGGPYYYNILPWEYCTDDTLKNCVAVTPGSSAPSGYPYASRIRWCNSAANAKARVPATGSCQGRRLGSFTVPRFGGIATPLVSYAFLTIPATSSAWPVSISDIKVNGVSIISASAGLKATVKTAADQATMAKNVATAINAYASTPEYAACAGTDCSSGAYATYGLGTVAANQVAIIAMVDSTTAVTDNSRAGYAITVTTPKTTNTYVSAGPFTVTKGDNKNGAISITVNTSPATSLVSTKTAIKSSNLNTNAQRICDAINSSTTGGLNPSYDSTNEFLDGTYSTNCSAASSSFMIFAYGSNASNVAGKSVTITTFGNLTLSGSGAVFGSAKSEDAQLVFGPSDTTTFTAGAASGLSPFQRVDIVPSRTSYPKGVGRTDCTSVAGACSYSEEMTNFANWYAYYRTRMLMMKSGASRAFSPLSDKYRLGFNTINNGTYSTSDTGGTNWLPVRDLTPTHKSLWYTRLFAANPSGSTPLRSALQDAGKYYDGSLLTDLPSPIQYSCQQNFTILSTDGFWNSDSGFAIGDWDNVDDVSKFCTRTQGCYDGKLGYSHTLSDVAAYYYRADLMPDMDNNVPVSDSDPNPAQHMTTFTLSLGVDGVMQYRSDYDTATTGDFYRVRTGDTGCPWATGTCNWPQPAADKDTAVDDLWHAAVAGHGKYFSAKDPTSLASGLSGALSALQTRVGSAAASATSTPNVTQEDNFEFSSTFRTVKWDGELVAQNIDVTTGATLSSVLWSARTELQKKVDDSSDTRTIYTIGSTVGSRRLFTWGNLTTDEKAWFANKCSGAGLWAQCPSLSSLEKNAANSGENLLNYLRGQGALEQYLADPTDTSATPVQVFRKRDFALGDIAGSKPAYVASPTRKYSDAGYSDFIAAQASRAPVVFAGGNDGYLHAFDADNGRELWAYVPRQVMSGMYKLADTSYGTAHQYYVDGSPVVGEVKSGSEWKTILVGGLNRGGRGYYAIDVTDPTNPQPLWEICHDSNLCVRSDVDIGYSYGEAIITKRPGDGKWVVIISSGYNNVSPGDGEGHVFVLDPMTGAILSKFDTNYGSIDTPSGLAKLADYAEDATVDRTSSYLYGGDLFGNVWRFELNTAATGVATKLAVLTNKSGDVLPITARPETGKCGSNKVVYVGTGRYLGESDVGDTSVQSMWGIKDSATSLGTLRSGGKAVEQDLSVITGGYALSSNPVDFSVNTGWFVDFDLNEGERISLDPALVNGNLIAVSTIPTSTGSAACGTGGKANLYQFNYCSGAAFNPLIPAGKMVSDSVVVGFTVVGLPTGARVKITKADGTKDVMQAEQGSGVGLSTSRVGWREITE